MWEKPLLGVLDGHEATPSVASLSNGPTSAFSDEPVGRIITFSGRSIEDLSRLLLVTRTAQNSPVRQVAQVALQAEVRRNEARRCLDVLAKEQSIDDPSRWPGSFQSSRTDPPALPLPEEQPLASATESRQKSPYLYTSPAPPNKRPLRGRRHPNTWWPLRNPRRRRRSKNARRSLWSNR